MHSRQNNGINQFSRLLLCLGLGVLMGGCNLMQPSLPESVKEPPLIPEPVAPKDDANLEATLNGNMNGKAVTLYEDMAELSDSALHNPQLREAVSKALEAGVLKPTSPQERFEPQKPICFGEFRDWAITYQNATAPVPNISMAPETGGLMGGIADMPASKLRIPPNSMNWSGHSVTASHILTRQELCALYVFLSNQDELARKLTPDAIDAANPAHDAMSLDEALSQFKDYANIGPWARRYVAVAYQDGLLQQVFNLFPNQLTGDEGFSPGKEISREEAIIFLDGLYGKNAHGQMNKLVKASDFNGTKGPAQPSAPIEKVQTLRESGPNGNRSAVRVNGPD